MRTPVYYRLNINAPQIAPLYAQFKADRGIPQRIPLSDAERADFEAWAIITLHKNSTPKE